jgi:hypothetical protein
MVKRDIGGRVLAVNVLYALVAPILVCSVWGCGTVVAIPAMCQQLWLVPALPALVILTGNAGRVFTDFRNNGGLYYVTAWFLFLVVSLAMLLMTRAI